MTGIRYEVERALTSSVAEAHNGRISLERVKELVQPIVEKHKGERVNKASIL